MNADLETWVRVYQLIEVLFDDPSDVQDIASLKWFFENPADMPLTVCRLALMLSEKESEG